MPWSYNDQQIAFLEGWGVFDNTDHGTQIERVDDMSEITGIEGALPIFACDEDARIFVEAQAANGSDLHRRALDVVIFDQLEGIVI